MSQTNRAERLKELLRQRIVIIDGAMGTMIQRFRLDEAAFRGERFKDHTHDLKGNNDLLSITQPQIIQDIHLQYLEAGADIIETNTFNCNSVSLADYKLETLAYELSIAGARNARAAVQAVEEKQPGRICFVAGAIGPTTKTASLSPNVNDPGYRAVSYDDLVTSYTENIRGLVD